LKQYEQILNKITPVFYKFEHYEKYFLLFNDLLPQYGKHVNIFLAYYIVPNRSICQTEDVYYCYNSDYKFFLINGTEKFLFKIMLNRRYTMKTSDEYAKLLEVIVDTVINKFVFENKRMECCLNKYDYTFKDLFIALVGKDTYDTIRRNIK